MQSLPFLARSGSPSLLVSCPPFSSWVTACYSVTTHPPPNTQRFETTLLVPRGVTISQSCEMTGFTWVAPPAGLSCNCSQVVAGLGHPKSPLVAHPRTKMAPWYRVLSPSGGDGELTGLSSPSSLPSVCVHVPDSLLVRLDFLTALGFQGSCPRGHDLSPDTRSKTPK